MPDGGVDDTAGPSSDPSDDSLWCDIYNATPYLDISRGEFPPHPAVTEFLARLLWTRAALALRARGLDPDKPPPEWDRTRDSEGDDAEDEGDVPTVVAPSGSRRLDDMWATFRDRALRK